MAPRKHKRIKGYFLLPVKSFEMNDERMSGREILALLRSVSSTPIQNRFHGYDEDRIVLTRRDSIEGDLVSIPDYDGYECCVFVRRRDVNLPFAGTESRDSISLDPLALEDASLMETTYFMIHHDSGIVLYYNNRAVGFYPHLATYLSKFLYSLDNSGGFQVNVDGEPAHRVTLAPVINSKRLERFNQLVEIKKLDLKVAGNMFDVHGQGSTRSRLNQMGDLKNDLGAKNLYITTTPKRGETLNRNPILHLLRGVESEVQDSDTCRFTVHGIDERSNYMIVDMLNDRFLFVQDVDYEGAYLPSSLVFEKMYTHFENMLPAIQDELSD